MNICFLTLEEFLVKRVLLSVIILFLWAFVLSACGLTESEKEREKIRLELEETMTSLYKALNEEDIDAYISHFSIDDEEIEKEMIVQTTNRFIYLDIKTSLVDVFYEEIKKDEAKLRVTERNLENSESKYKYMDNEREVIYLLKKEDGKWVIKEKMDAEIREIDKGDITNENQESNE